MKRISLGVLALALVALSAAPAAAAGDLSIREVDTEGFPTVSITTSIDADRLLTSKDVTVMEDGARLEDVTIESFGDSGGTVDVVLVIDTSGSMQGEPIASAVAAALRFVTKLPDDIGAGIVTFSDRPTVLKPITTNHSTLLSALGNLKADGETALYDGVKTAAGMFEGDGQHNMIVLSDGADTASKATLAQATGAAKHSGASIFTVGLTSGEFDEGALKKLSAATEGSYAPAATAKLASVYQNLATELSNQYVISYSSANKDGGETRITVSALGATDTALVLTPKIEPPAKKDAPQVEQPSPLLQAMGTPMGLLIAAGTTFGALFLFLLMVLGTGARKRRDRELARRTAASSHAASTVAESANEGFIPEAFVQAAESAGRVGGLAGRIDAKMELAGAPLRTGEFLVAVIAACMVGAVVGGALLGGLGFALLTAIVGAAIPFIWLTFAARRRMSKLHAQLADILMILANALRAGHSFMQALDLVAQEIGEPAGEEFGRLVAEVRLGRPVDEALNSLAERIGSDDFKWALLAVNIQRDVGGNLAEVLDTVSETIRERDGIRRQIDVLTAEGRLSVWILAGLPVVVAIYLAWVNPDYLSLLVNNAVGILMTITASVLLFIGIFWMKKVVKIDV
ncbi:MAG: VWA domain-containing protein [Actinomycetota bacterium]